MNHILISYWACAGLGFIYIVGMAALGHLHGSEEMEHSGEDPGDVDASASSDADAGDPGDVNADIDSGDPGDVDTDMDGGDPGDVDSNTGRTHHHNQANIVAVSRKRTYRIDAWYFKLLGILSPTKLAIFLFFFGSTGVMMIQLLPALGLLTIIPSALSGWLISKIVLGVMGNFVSRLHSSTNFKQESLVGTVAKLNLSIQPGSLGEITFTTPGGRYNGRARAKNKEQAISNFSKVIICDIENGVYVVEPAED